MNSSLRENESDLDEQIDDQGILDAVEHHNQKRSCGIFLPDATYKVIWDFIGFICIIYQSIVIPFRLCFNEIATGFFYYFELG